MNINDYHPHQMAFVGNSGSGKTTLIEKLVTILSNHYLLGYAKHDGHRFVMDQPGKDSHRIYAAGARTVSIASSEELARRSHVLDHYPKPLLFSNCDAVIIEGHKKCPYLKILMLSSEDDPLLASLKNGELENVLATVSSVDCAPSHLPHFQRDQVNAISQFILDQWIGVAHVAPLCGLVLAGGRSRRMNQDKSQLIYQGLPQYQRLLKMVQDICGDSTFVSCRQDQNLPGQRIDDSFINIGPMGGILSAMMLHPQAAWLVVAVDMPFLQTKHLQHLAQERQPLKVATAYCNPQNKLPEPLLAIYEPKAKMTLLQFLGWDIRCPRKVLQNCNAAILECPDSKCLENANTPDDFMRFKAELTCAEG